MPPYLAGDEDEWPSPSPSSKSSDQELGPDLKLEAQPQIKVRDIPLPHANAVNLVKQEPGSPNATSCQKNAKRHEWSSRRRGEDGLNNDVNDQSPLESPFSHLLLPPHKTSASNEPTPVRRQKRTHEEELVPDENNQPETKRTNFNGPSEPTSSPPARNACAQNHPVGSPAPLVAPTTEGATATLASGDRSTTNQNSTPKRIRKPRKDMFGLDDRSRRQSNNDAFLVACIKHSREKISVNFDTLSKELGMSSGGAGNKFRALMKQLAADGVLWAKIETRAPPKPKNTKPKPISASTAPCQTDHMVADKSTPTKATEQASEDPQDRHNQTSIVIE